MVMEIMRLDFPICHRPVLSFLCHFARSPSLLLFHLHSLFVLKGENLLCFQNTKPGELTRSGGVGNNLEISAIIENNKKWKKLKYICNNRNRMKRFEKIEKYFEK